MIDMSHRQMLLVKDSLIKVLCDGGLEDADRLELSQLITELSKVYQESINRIYCINERIDSRNYKK